LAGTAFSVATATTITGNASTTITAKLNIAYVVPKSQPFCSKYNIDWKKVEQVKISNYSKQQAFGWRSTHGKLYGNKGFFRFGVKQSRTCGYCDDPRQSVEHLYTECTYSKRLFAVFECKKLGGKLYHLEKLIGMDPSIRGGDVQRG
jgi:hypothetical protein